MAETQETNGQNKETAISKLLKKWREGGSKVPDKKEQKALLDQFKALHAKREAIQNDLDKANAALAGHSEKMVLAFGDFKLEVDGRRFFPASRGDTVFYREEGKTDPGRIIKA